MIWTIGSKQKILFWWCLQLFSGYYLDQGCKNNNIFNFKELMAPFKKQHFFAFKKTGNRLQMILIFLWHTWDLFISVIYDLCKFVLISHKFDYFWYLNLALHLILTFTMRNHWEILRNRFVIFFLCNVTDRFSTYSVVRYHGNLPFHFVFQNALNHQFHILSGFDPYGRTKELMCCRCFVSNYLKL